MAKYRRGESGILNTEDGRGIPPDPKNRDYVKALREIQADPACVEDEPSERE